MPRLRRGWHTDPYVSPFVQHAVSKAQARAKTSRKPKTQPEWDDNFTRQDLFDPKLRKREIFKPVPGKYMAEETPLDMSSDSMPSFSRKKVTTRTNKEVPVNNPYKRMQELRHTLSEPSPQSPEQPRDPPQEEVPLCHDTPMPPSPFSMQSSATTPPRNTSPPPTRHQQEHPSVPIRRVITRSTSPIDERTLHSILQHPEQVRRHAQSSPPALPPTHPAVEEEKIPVKPAASQQNDIFSKMLDMQLRTQELNNQANETYMTNMMRMLERMLPAPPSAMTQTTHSLRSHLTSTQSTGRISEKKYRRVQKKASPKSEMMNIVLQKLQEIESVEEDIMRRLTDKNYVTSHRQSSAVKTPRTAEPAMSNAMSIPSEIRDAKPTSSTPLKMVHGDEPGVVSPAYDISRAPRISDTHEISPLYHKTLDQKSITYRKLFNDDDKHFAEKQQRYYQSLVLAQSDPMQQQDCDKYRKDLKNARRMRELAYREHGTSVCELGNRLTERLLDDLLDDLTEELDGVFDDYASCRGEDFSWEKKKRSA